MGKPNSIESAPTAAYQPSTKFRTRSAQGNDGIGAAQTPVHAGTLEPGPDRHLAARLHHTRRGAQALGVKCGIVHAVLVALDIVGALAGLLTTSRMAPQRLAEALELTGI